MSGQKEFIQFMGLAGGTLLGLFALQYWFGTYIDVGYHDALSERGGFEVVEETRAQERKALVGLPAAMSKLAKSRSADARVTPKASDDVSAMSGWVQHPAFETYVPDTSARAVAPASPTQEHAQ